MKRISSSRRFKTDSVSRATQRGAWSYWLRGFSASSSPTGRERPTLMDIGASLALLGLALAWALYRLERSANRRRDISAARGLLLGVKRGMVGGWGDEYFANRWTTEKADDAARTHKRL